MSVKLALFGGRKAINKTFKKYNSFSTEEVEAAKKVIESGILSEYLARDHKDFYGGKKVLEFESQCKLYFKVKHAITFNSWTSGLISAVGAIGTEPGDEIIVSPWTMAASATAILHWNAIPVFADIDKETFCLDPSSVERNISSQTKAILSVDIAGQSADVDALNNLAKKYNLKIISDSAQAPGAKVNNKFVGTATDIGGFSLNYHKHIHTGEGGVAVTNDDFLAERMRLIRNHGEVVVSERNTENIVNMIGHNFRLGEIECAIGIEQLKKLENRVLSRQKIAKKFDDCFKNLKGLNPPKVRNNCSHVYYSYCMTVDESVTGVSRDIIYKALISEGVPLSKKYDNIHLLDLYQKKIAYGSKGFPWTSDICKREISYKKGICPNAETLNENSFLGFGICSFELENIDVKMILEAFQKVWDNLDKLKNYVD